MAKYSQAHPVASAELPRNPRHFISSRDPIPGKYLRGGSLVAKTENNSGDEVRRFTISSSLPRIRWGFASTRGSSFRVYGVGGRHITAEFLLKLLTFHLHKLLLGIRRIEKRASARASASEVLPRKLPRAQREALFGSCPQPVSDVIAGSS